MRPSALPNRTTSDWRTATRLATFQGHRPSIPSTTYGPAMTTRRDLLPGTLDMLVLKTLDAQSMHGYGIAQHLQRLSDDVIRVEEGSLYPALQRMRQRGWIRAEWRQTPNNQRARYYTITAAGRRQLGVVHSGFAVLVAAIQRIMKPA